MAEQQTLTFYEPGERFATISKGYPLIWQVLPNGHPMIWQSMTSIELDGGFIDEKSMVVCGWCEWETRAAAENAHGAFLRHRSENVCAPKPVEGIES